MGEILTQFIVQFLVCAIECAGIMPGIQGERFPYIQDEIEFVGIACGTEHVGKIKTALSEYGNHYPSFYNHSMGTDRQSTALLHFRYLQQHCTIQALHHSTGIMVFQRIGNGRLQCKYLHNIQRWQDLIAHVLGTGRCSGKSETVDRQHILAPELIQRHTGAGRSGVQDNTFVVPASYAWQHQAALQSFRQ